MATNNKATLDQDARFQELYERARSAATAAQREAEARVAPDGGDPWVSGRLIVLDEDDGFARWLDRGTGRARARKSTVIRAGVIRESVVIAS